MQPKGLFSPSLQLRSEPPYSFGVVLSVGKDAKNKVRTAAIRFKNRTYTCRSLHTNLVVGEKVALIEAPRGTFWIRRNGPSWFAKPLADWVKAGRHAQVAMEYFLKDCRKYSPFLAIPKAAEFQEYDGDDFILTEDPTDKVTKDPVDDTVDVIDKDTGDYRKKDGTDGRKRRESGQDDFYKKDKDDDDSLDRDEWNPKDGDFDTVDENKDGKISIDEWKRWKKKHEGDPVLPPSVWITCSPNHLSAPGQVTVTWGSSNESSAIVIGSNGESWSGTSGSQTIAIPKTSLFTITGGSGKTDDDICYVGNIPGWSPSTGWMLFCNRTLGWLFQTFATSPGFGFHAIKPPSGAMGSQFEFWFGNGDLTGWSITGRGNYGEDPVWLAAGIASLQMDINNVVSKNFKFYLKDGTTGLRAVSSISIITGFNQYHRVISFGPSSFTTA